MFVRLLPSFLNDFDGMIILQPLQICTCICGFFNSLLDVSPEAPIVTLFGLFLQGLGDKGVKATTTGNLPRNLCRDIALAYLGEEEYREYYRLGEPRTEREFFGLHVTRLVSGLAGFVRKYEGRFIVTDECRKIMSKHGPAGIYPKLFREFATKYNWAYRDHRQEITLIQQSFLFTLYLLQRHGAERRANRFYEDWFLRAFPSVLQEVTPIGEYFSSEQIVRTSYSFRCLQSFGEFLGLVGIERDTAKQPDGIFHLRKHPLLDHAVHFHQ